MSRFHLQGPRGESAHVKRGAGGDALSYPNIMYMHFFAITTYGDSTTSSTYSNRACLARRRLLPGVLDISYFRVGSDELTRLSYVDEDMARERVRTIS